MQLRVRQPARWAATGLAGRHISRRLFCLAPTTLVSSSSSHCECPKFQQTFVVSGLLTCARCLLAQSSPPPPSSSLLSLAVHPTLVEELHLIIARGPCDAWCPVSAVYSELPAAMRRQHVRQHKTMLHVLEKVKDELGIVLSASGVYYAQGNPPPEQQAAEAGGPFPSSSPALSSATPKDERERKAKVVDGAHQSLAAETPAPAVLSPSGVTDVSGCFDNHGPPPVDFFYDVGLTAVPPPPADFDVTPSALAPAQTSADGSVLSLRDYVGFIPSFFVPLQDALAGMPGYTEGHIEGYLNTSKAMELIQLAGAKYVRLYGGYAKIGLEGGEEAEAAFDKYRPRRGLVPAFVDAFSGITEQWMPLTMLLSRADPTAVAQLPFQGPAAIFFFAQMQDVFGFSVNNDGVTSSVLLRRPVFGGLECETTPTPKSFNFLLHRTPLDGNVDVQVLLDTLPQPLRDEIALYYGDIFRFFNAHAPVFFLAEDHSVVMRTSYKRRLHLASLPLEEQLRIALEQRDKGRIRTLRRRIAFRDNPSHPFHDPDNLAQEVAKYLPRKGFVTLKTFLKKQVPEEVLFFMPKKIHNFFQNYSQYFQQFEYQQAGSWAVSRPGQPLPRGVIRKEFTEDDLVALTAEYLQQKGSRSCSTIFLHLPRGAQEVVRKRHGGLFYFAGKYPQYFSVVLGSDTENAQSSAVVHLVQVPTRHLQGPEGDAPATLQESTEDETGESEDVDRGSAQC